MSRFLKIHVLTLAGLLFFMLVGLKTQAQKGKEWMARPTLPVSCQLGEGAFWDSNRRCLWFVDIENGKVHWYDPGTKKEGSFASGQKTGTVVPAAPPANRLVLGLQDGVYACGLGGENLTKWASIQQLASNQRLNDGKCDPAGRLWVGSMNLDKATEKAHLFKIDAEGKATEMLDSVSISNGIVWTRDHKTMFYIDTPTRKVKAFDFDFQAGTLSNPRTLVSIPDSLGWPDGMTLDENNDLWIGMWGGFCVSHWSGTTGQYLGKVKVAAPNVTSCAFGGTNFETLYITTARQGLKPEVLRQYPGSGNVFEATVGVKGYQVPYWKPKP